MCSENHSREEICNCYGFRHNLLLRRVKNSFFEHVTDLDMNCFVGIMEGIL